jgi:tetratricopeptide (TPR) repeat protein
VEDKDTAADVAVLPESVSTASGPDIHPAGGPAGAAPAAVRMAVDAPAETEGQLPELLSKARQALHTDRLLIPAGRSAYDYYRQALLLDPDNTQAQQGINRIVSRYTALAGYAITQGDADRADRYIERGLRVQPDDERLLAMQRNLKVVTTPVVAPDAPPQELPPPALENPAKPGFLQRFKTLFPLVHKTKKHTRTDPSMTFEHLNIWGQSKNSLTPESFYSDPKYHPKCPDVAVAGHLTLSGQMPRR